MQKKILSTLMAFVLMFGLFGLVGCDKKANVKTSTSGIVQTKEDTKEDKEAKDDKETTEDDNKEAKEETKEETKENEKAEAENSLWKNLYKNGFYVDSQNRVIQRKDIGDRRVLVYVTDPFCPACKNLSSILKDEMSSILGDDAVVYYRTVGFLGGMTPEDNSERLAAYILGVAEYAPEIASVYYGEVMSNDTCIATAQGCTEEDYKAMFFKVGGKSEQWNDIIKAKTKLMTTVNEGTEDFFTDPDVVAMSRDGQSLYVPFIYMDGATKALDFSEALDVVEHIREAVQQ